MWQLQRGFFTLYVSTKQLIQLFNSHAHFNADFNVADIKLSESVMEAKSGFGFSSNVAICSSWIGDVRNKFVNLTPSFHPVITVVHDFDLVHAVLVKVWRLWIVHHSLAASNAMENCSQRNCVSLENFKRLRKTSAMPSSAAQNSVVLVNLINR